MRPTAGTLREIYRRLRKKFGGQGWWPADSAFEVMVGTILTQSTAWVNAALAIENLKRERLLSPLAIARARRPRLARAIRSSGYFNQKAVRLQAFVRFFLSEYGGSADRMRRQPAGLLREQLLALPGIGPETADSILLYALDKPVFVVDAYTRRFMARHSFIDWDDSYEEIQALFARQLPQDRRFFNEYHALIVALGKNICRNRPKCDICPLRELGRLRLETPSATSSK